MCDLTCYKYFMAVARTGTLAAAGYGQYELAIRRRD